MPTQCPVHVTVRIRRGLPSLRQRRFVRAFKHSLSACCVRDGFRVVHYSIQRNHLHFLVEAHGRVALGRGMKSLGARIGRCVNRVFGRSGRVLDGRYHHRVLRTPREVRRALAYVLLNARHHYYERYRKPPPRVQLDPASSAVWFEGWKRAPPLDRPPPDRQPGAPPATRATTADAIFKEVARAHTWLLSAGWRRHRLIDPAEVPGARQRMMHDGH